MKKITIVLGALMVSGCASVVAPTEKEAASINNFYRSGNVSQAVATIDQIYAKSDEKTPKDSTYYLEKGTMIRNFGQNKLQESSKLLFGADYYVKQWEDKANLSLNMTPTEFADAFVKSSELSKFYQPRDYEKSMLSFSLALNHSLARRYDLAGIENRKLINREVLIQNLRQKDIDAIKKKQNPSEGATSKVEEIKGYPVEIFASKEVNELKNSYQNAAAYYLSGFISEAQGDAAEASQSYRRAVQLRSNNRMFVSGLSNVDNKTNKSVAGKSETLVVVESGFLSDIYSHKSQIPFVTKRGPKIVTIVLPAFANNAQFFNPEKIVVGGQAYPLIEAANIEFMSRREMKDQMPSYVLRATTSAIIQLAVQEAAQRQIEKNQNDKNAALKSLLVAGAVAAMSSGDVDVRMWKSLPSQVYMTRASLPTGAQSLQISTPVGIKTVPINLNEPYEIVHIRVFNGGAVVNNYAKSDGKYDPRP